MGTRSPFVCVVFAADDCSNEHVLIIISSFLLAVELDIIIRLVLLRCCWATCAHYFCFCLLLIMQ
jgi:hypothetical protein